MVLADTLDSDNSIRIQSISSSEPILVQKQANLNVYGFEPVRARFPEAALHPLGHARIFPVDRSRETSERACYVARGLDIALSTPLARISAIFLYPFLVIALALRKYLRSLKTGRGREAEFWRAK